MRSGGSRIGNSILCSQFRISSQSLIAETGNGMVKNQDSAKNLFGSAQDIPTQG